MANPVQFRERTTVGGYVFVIKQSLSRFCAAVWRLRVAISKPKRRVDREREFFRYDSLLKLYPGRTGVDRPFANDFAQEKRDSVLCKPRVRENHARQVCLSGCEKM